MQKAGDFEAMPKKEALRHTRELEKLQRNLGGIRGLDKLPDAIFVIDTNKEHIAVTEANKLGLPIVAVVDTNCDPDVITHVIPGNDDAIRSGALLCRVVADAVTEGRFIAQNRPAPAPKSPPPAPARSAAGTCRAGGRGTRCPRRRRTGRCAGAGRAGRAGRRGTCGRSPGRRCPRRRNACPRGRGPCRRGSRSTGRRGPRGRGARRRTPPSPPPHRPRRSDRARIHRQGRPEVCVSRPAWACSTPSAHSRRMRVTWTSP